MSVIYSSLAGALHSRQCHCRLQGVVGVFWLCLRHAATSEYILETPICKVLRDSCSLIRAHSVFRVPGVATQAKNNGQRCNAAVLWKEKDASQVVRI